MLPQTKPTCVQKASPTIMYKANRAPTKSSRCFLKTGNSSEIAVMMASDPPN